MTERNRAWDPKRYPQTLLEMAVMYSVLSALGYNPETEISVSFTSEDANVLIKTDGFPTIELRIGASEFSTEEMIVRWEELVTDWNTVATIADKEAVCNTFWEKSVSLFGTSLAGDFQKEVEPVKKRQWDPSRYPSVVLDAVATFAILKLQYGHTNLPAGLALVGTNLALVIGANLALITSRASFEEDSSYVLIGFGTVPCPPEEAKCLIDELIAGWETVIPAEFKRHVCEAVRQKEFFLKAIRTLDAFQTPSSGTIH